MPEGTSRAPSIVDVARVAGVAFVTVSRVLNNPSSVSPDTRRRVEEAVAELGYRRNNMARALKRGGRSTTLGVVLAGTQLHELPKILLGIETAAREAGYWVSIMSWQGGAPDQLTDAVQRLSEQMVEGIAIIANRASVLPVMDEFAPQVPVTIVMSGDTPNHAMGSVEFDQVLGARLATRHLRDLGHTQIAHVSGRLDAFDARARIDGWRAEMEMTPGARAVLVEGDFTAESGYATIRDLWSAPDRPTAVFLSNDQMAMGALAAFSELGVRVPHDVSVVGFDDIVGSAFLIPSLTTVRQDHQALGERSIEVLLGMISGERPAHHLIEPTLIARGSTAASPSASSAASDGQRV